ncbi:MAG: cell division protein FtsL [Candidatus Moranbacteria bacterium]|nr:cell division protein FtsL [Candidatus Moranbacteria bacterium]
MNATQISIAHANPMTFGEKKKARRKQPAKTGWTTLNFFLVVMICAFGVAYIFEVNQVATQGYQIRDLEKQVDQLKDDNEKLQIKEAQLRSMYDIEEKAKNLNMTAPKDVSYMSLPGNVAMK